MIKTYGITNKDFPYLTAAVDQNGKKVLVNSSKKMNDYMSPAQMLEVAVASCLTMTTKGVLYSHGITYRDVHVSAKIDVNEESSHIHLSVEIDADLDDQLKEEYIQEAYNKCYVRNVLTHPITSSLE